jgi:hypothetical protein
MMLVADLVVFRFAWFMSGRGHPDLRGYKEAKKVRYAYGYAKITLAEVKNKIFDTIGFCRDTKKRAF